MNNTEKTMILSQESLKKERIAVALRKVAEALEERGYHPESQISGYVISGDPAYITSYKGARKEIMQFSAQEIAEFLLEKYLEE